MANTKRFFACLALAGAAVTLSGTAYAAPQDVAKTGCDVPLPRSGANTAAPSGNDTCVATILNNGDFVIRKGTQLFEVGTTE
ncbi:hypothetical protein EF910_02190 [Streptomyces sp. WAC07149]|uniref:hypothetical protein n=1 Tax=Streptomyces sp. WAC07149 TaxID=2487425 RepID=UPI000F780650|nr:hypothetical protein [Streptomyces sp. WAC07149]RST09035.1 hypothetical protein EF910_02190 [Streptomyces sp. WAC07149]